MTEAIIVESEFTRGDYLKFEGVQPWVDGAAPVIAFGRLETSLRFVVVLHKTGARVFFDLDERDWFLNRDFETQEDAFSFSKGIKGWEYTKEDFLSRFGFEEAKG